MTCDAVTAHLLEPHSPAPEGLAAHLASCPRCRALARAHQAALTLSAAPPPALPLDPMALSAVRRTVSRRRARRAAVGTLAVAALVLGVQLRRPPVPAPASEAPAGEFSLRAEASASASLGALLAEVDAYAEPLPPDEDPLYAPFGALAAWVQPPPSSTLVSPTFQEALAPLFPEEEVP